MMQWIIETILKKELRSMGARNASKPYQPRKLRVSDHARDRFRERGGRTLGHLDDNALFIMLEERVRFSAEAAYTVRDPRAPTSITSLQPFEYEKQMLYAVVRENTVVTILDEQQARNNFDTWEPVLNAPFADVLRNVTPVRGLVDVAKLEKNLAATVVETELESEARTAPKGGNPDIPLADIFRAATEQYENAVFAAREARQAAKKAVLALELAQAAVETTTKAAADAAARIVACREELIRLETAE